MAGLTKIPAIVKNLDDKESSKVALIENLQRKDLSPIEEARTYQKILELEDGMTQEQLAATLGKTQSSVSNKLRLLDLPEEIQDALLKEKISERHARSLLSLEDKNDQIKMMDKVIAEKMTVRELDKEIKEMKDGPQEISPAIVEVNNTPSETNQSNVDIPSVETNVEEQKVEETTPVLQVVAEETSAPQIETVPEQEGPKLATFDNITSVDIDKIRENSTDIGNIVKSETQQNNTESSANNNTEPVKEEFSFTPSFGIAQDTNNTVTEVTSPPENSMFAQFFNSNADQALPSSDTIASSISTNEIAVPAVTPTKDVSGAITGVKETINNLKNEGYNIVYEEVDNPNDYRITIQINKN